MSGHDLDTRAVYNSALSVTVLHGASSQLQAARGARWGGGLLDLFQACTQPSTIAEPFRTPGISQSFSSPPTDTLFPQICLLGLGQGLVGPNWYHRCGVKQRLLVVFDTGPEEGAFLQMKLESGQKERNKKQKTPILGFLLGRCRTDSSKRASVLEIGLCEELDSHSGPSRSCKAVGYRTTEGLGKR